MVSNSSKSTLHESVVLAHFHKLSREAFTPRMIGFMLNKAWVYAVFFNTGLMFLSSPSHASLSLLNIASLSALTLTLLLGGILNERCNILLKSKLGCSIPAVLSIAGTAALPFADSVTLFGRIALYSAAILTGIGSGGLLLLWGRVYAEVSGPVTAAETSLAFIFAALLIPIYFIAPYMLQFILVSLLPIASSVILYRELKRIRIKQDIDVKQETSPSRSIGGLSWKRALSKIALSSFVFGCIVTVMRYVFEVQYYAEASLDLPFILTLSVFLAGCIVLAVLLLSKRLDLAFSYRPVLLFLALGCFLVPLFDQGSIIPYFFARAGYVCFEIMNWIMLADISYRSSYAPFRVFGFGRASCSSGILAGSLCGSLFEKGLSSSPEMSAAISGALLLILIITYTFTLTERDVARITRQHDRQAKNNKDVSISSSLESRIEMISAQYGLGERATEVLFLLAKGRSGSRIEQELYISKGTVNFHLRNIYQKLGVHSRQELIDLIDRPDPT